VRAFVRACRHMCVRVITCVRVCARVHRSACSAAVLRTVADAVGELLLLAPEHRLGQERALRRVERLPANAHAMPKPQRFPRTLAAHVSFTVLRNAVESPPRGCALRPGFPRSDARRWDRIASHAVEPTTVYKKAFASSARCLQAQPARLPLLIALLVDCAGVCAAVRRSTPT
jgi:hypothetical protein